MCEEFQQQKKKKNNSEMLFCWNGANINICMVTSEQSTKYFSFEHELLLIVEVVGETSNYTPKQDAEAIYQQRG